MGPTLIDGVSPDMPASCEEIAWTVAFLASPAGAYVTGQTWAIDGGRSLAGAMSVRR